MISESLATFSQYSDLYARYRPNYPEDLYQWLLPLCTSYELAWDGATGTGQTALRLGQSFDRVEANDISAAQLRVADSHPKVHYQQCPVEKTSYENEAFDLITVSQALHWFHYSAFWPEVLRVLKPGGVFAAWGYHACSVTPQVDQATEVFLAIIEPFWSSRNEILWDGFSSTGCPLPLLEAPAFAMHHDWSLQQYLGFLNTLSASKLCRQALGERVLHEATDLIAQAWGKPGAVRQAKLPLRLLVARKP